MYHQNIVQGIYAFILGCIIAYFYEIFGHFYVPVGVHIVSNVVAYLLTVTGLGTKLPINWPTCLGMLIIGAGALTCCYGMRQKLHKENDNN